MIYVFYWAGVILFFLLMVYNSRMNRERNGFFDYVSMFLLSLLSWLLLVIIIGIYIIIQRAEKKLYGKESEEVLQQRED